MNLDPHLEARIAEELQIQKNVNKPFHPLTCYHLLGTILQAKKYMDCVHIDFFFQHLMWNSHNNCFFIQESPTRKVKIIDFWIYLFRHGFTLQHKAPSGTIFNYGWQYLDWLRRQSNVYLIAFFAENALRVKISILESIVKMLMQTKIASFLTCSQHTYQVYEKIGSIFIVLPGNIVGFVLPGDKTGVKASSDVIEKYAIDNFEWNKSITNNNKQNATYRISSKQSCCSLLHVLFLVSAALFYKNRFLGNNKPAEIVDARIQTAMNVFLNRPSSHAKVLKIKKQCYKEQKTNNEKTNLQKNETEEEDQENQQNNNDNDMNENSEQEEGEGEEEDDEDEDEDDEDEDEELNEEY